MASRRHTPAPRWARSVENVCSAIAALLHPYAEVALHDLASDTIVGLWNPLSGRKIGDPSLLVDLPESWQERPVQGPYPKVRVDGRELSSVSAVVPDEGGMPAGLLCINLDRGPLLDAVALLSGFAEPLEGRPTELFVRDWREQIALEVDAFCRERGFDRGRLSRRDRRELVAHLDDAGLFATRNAAAHAARALGISRATVYALLKEVRLARVA